MSAICGPALRVIQETDAGERWCFRCRARTTFTDRVLVTAEPSYWPPIIDRRCPSGHTDGDVGFGRSREWDVPW